MDEALEMVESLLLHISHWLQLTVVHPLALSHRIHSNSTKGNSSNTNSNSFTEQYPILGWHLDSFMRGLAKLDTILQTRQWLAGGEAPSIADVSGVCGLCQLTLTKQLDLGRYVNFLRWMNEAAAALGPAFVTVTAAFGTNESGGVLQGRHALGGGRGSLVAEEPVREHKKASSKLLRLVGQSGLAEATVASVRACEQTVLDIVDKADSAGLVIEHPERQQRVIARDALVEAPSWAVAQWLSADRLKVSPNPFILAVYIAKATPVFPILDTAWLRHLP